MSGCAGRAGGSAAGVDRQWHHLYPPFRRALARTHAQAREETGHEWMLVEGYRTAERQLGLYAQGRTRPGPIVTWMRFPEWHGCGLAGDSAPVRGGGPWWDAPLPVWRVLRSKGQLNGLVNPAWLNGDRGHLQHADVGLQSPAAVWCRAGFQELAERGDGDVYVNGQLVSDAALRIIEDRAYVWSRAVIESAGWVMNLVDAEAIYVSPPRGGDVSRRLPAHRVGHRAYLAAGVLTRLGWTVTWRGSERRLLIEVGGKP